MRGIPEPNASALGAVKGGLGPQQETSSHVLCVVAVMNSAYVDVNTSCHEIKMVIDLMAMER